MKMMRGLNPVPAAGKAPRDYWERGEDIPRERVPDEVMAAFEGHMEAFKDYMEPYQMGEFARNGGASMTFRMQPLGPGVEDYIMQYLMTHPNPMTGKKGTWMISVEVRNGTVGDAVTRYSKIED